MPPATRRRHLTVAALAASAVLLVLGLAAGLLPAALVFLATPAVLSRLEPAATRRRTAQLVADLPLAVDLLAACLRAGRPPQASIAVVAQSLGGPLADLLAEVERRLSLGADPIDAWSCLLKEPACATFARATQRALRSGAPLAGILEHQANDTRQARRWTAEEHARAVESRSVVPLGLCFLPAFVLLGIVPTIASSLSGLLSFLG
ncbi:type II secretion system F family protein [Kribbella sp. CA-293567]|uniref:type II secretion system F family protein n=1 Tax=Kribbella sp. CA-293567 TaxID=3002436 RepID=UPI0022DDF02F|nr:type II secretion system F family protein [Kribbella sp. CA-293567]WBQ04912.1 type II secretion system F family protein [Kribbella sp. CA-293567]